MHISGSTVNENVKSISDDEVKQPGRLCGFLYAGGHGSAGRAVAFYLETMLDDGLLPADRL